MGDSEFVSVKWPVYLYYICNSRRCSSLRHSWLNKIPGEDGEFLNRVKHWTGSQSRVIFHVQWHPPSPKAAADWESPTELCTRSLTTVLGIVLEGQGQAHLVPGSAFVKGDVFQRLVTFLVSRTGLWFHIRSLCSLTTACVPGQLPQCSLLYTVPPHSLVSFAWNSHLPETKNKKTPYQGLNHQPYHTCFSVLSTKTVPYERIYNAGDDFLSALYKIPYILIHLPYSSCGMRHEVQPRALVFNRGQRVTPSQNLRFCVCVHARGAQVATQHAVAFTGCQTVS